MVARDKERLLMTPCILLLFFQVHYIGWCLTLVVGVQIPVIALIMIIYYAVKRDCLSVFQPTSEWGPGDKNEMRAWHTHNYNKASPLSYKT